MASDQTLSEFGKVLLALVIVLDPIAILPVLVGLRSMMPPAEARWIAMKVIAGATTLLLFFTATGTWVLRVFGVTINDLRIGGGLLLLIISIRMVVEGRMTAAGQDNYRAALVPIISPLLVGPGAITASIVLAGIYGIWFTSLAVLAAMIVCLLVFLSTGVIHRVIGDSGTDLVTRIMGMLIATIAVSYITAGTLGAIRMSAR